MKKVEVSIPEIGFLAGTRGALGAGLALLLGDKLDSGRKRKLGWILFLFGVLTTIPLAKGIFCKAH